MKDVKKVLILVFGVSGSGLGTVVRTLEDMGLYCIDNLPFELLSSTIELLQKKYTTCLGFVFGIHTKTPLNENDLQDLKKKYENDFLVDLVFISAENSVIVNRYDSNRRRHPLVEENKSLEEAICEEKILLSNIENLADLVVDTSNFSPHQLSRLIEKRYKNKIPERKLHVCLTSFGFKNGVPQNIDSLFDVRFLKNPYFVPHLAPKTGLDEEICEFLSEDSEVLEFKKRLSDWLLWLLPKYYQEGKHYFRVGVGCTGGRHRSVFMCESILKELQEKNLPNTVLYTFHREL